LAAKASALLFATCGAVHAVDLNAADRVASEALLYLRRGYADPASRARPGPRFHVPTGLAAETLSAFLLANLATLELVTDGASAAVSSLPCSQAKQGRFGVSPVSADSRAGAPLPSLAR
jgi:hypothetical protein